MPNGFGFGFKVVSIFIYFNIYFNHDIVQTQFAFL